MPDPPATLQEYVAAWLAQQGGYADPAIAAAPLFRGTNEKDPATGAAVVRADYGPSVADAVTASPWTKAQTIGAPQLGEHYVPASIGEILASDNPLRLIAEHLMGSGRPRSLVAADPYGIDTALAGKGSFPALMATMEPVVPGIRGYHGSPHDFDMFALEKIGTGEGTQAHGPHGVYIAEQEGTAQGYRQSLAGMNATDARMASLLQKHQGAMEPALDEFMQSVYDTPKVKQKMRDSLLKQWATRPPGGRMYEVNIKADPAQFLNWDKPISEQPAAVQELVAARWASTDPSAPRTGAELYRALGPDAKSAAELLRTRGVPGVAYVDPSPRRAGEGMNYVVHDASLIDILRKYGLLAPLAAGAAGRALAPDEGTR